MHSLETNILCGISTWDYSIIYYLLMQIIPKSLQIKYYFAPSHESIFANLMIIVIIVQENRESVINWLIYATIANYKYFFLSCIPPHE